jgi:hypothetical protein
VGTLYIISQDILFINKKKWYLSDASVFNNNNNNNLKYILDQEKNIDIWINLKKNSKNLNKKVKKFKKTLKLKLQTIKCGRKKVKKKKQIEST